ncbi:hypothetical protein SAMN02745823_03895, partial [Sporobacter termitidis DSM 10068]
YCSASPSVDNAAKYGSFIEQARVSILAYCHQPMGVMSFPDWMLMPWVEISYAIMNGGVFERSKGVVTSINEDDTAISFATDINKATMPTVDYSQILNHFRRLY